MSETSGLATIFETCRRENRAALIGYLPTGYPDVATSIDAMVGLVESGCDIVEVGIAYSDPGMDGPTIARATEAALARRCAGARRADRGRGDQQGGRPRGGDDVLEPGAALRRRRLLAGSGGRGRPRADHPRPDPRRGGRLDRGLRRGTGWTGSSWWRRRRPRSDWPPPSTPRADSSTPPRPWGLPVPGTRCPTRRPNWLRGCEAVSDIPVGVGLGVRSREQAAEIGVLRRRRDRRIGAGVGLGWRRAPPCAR